MSKGEQQRAHLIDVARDLFVQRGYEGTTTRMLNKAAGTSDGLLYYYFPHGKQEILDTIVQEGVQQRVDDTQIDFTAVKNRPELEVALTRFITGIWQLFVREDNYQSFMITIRERMVLSENESAWLRQFADDIRERLLHAMRKLDTALGYSIDQINVMTEAVVAVMESTLYEQLLIKNSRTFDEHQTVKLRQMLQLILQS